MPLDQLMLALTVMGAYLSAVLTGILVVVVYAVFRKG